MLCYQSIVNVEMTSEGSNISIKSESIKENAHDDSPKAIFNTYHSVCNHEQTKRFEDLDKQTHFFSFRLRATNRKQKSHLLKDPVIGQFETSKSLDLFETFVYKSINNFPSTSFFSSLAKTAHISDFLIAFRVQEIRFQSLPF